MSQKTIIYITRHGQTEWNVLHKMQGHQDSPLTSLGINQAEWLRDAMSGEKIDVIYSSSSPRAVKTAEIIKANRELAIIEAENLREMNLGEWEGQIQAELKTRYPEQFHNFWNDPEHFSVPGGETYQEVLTRSTHILHDILAKHEGKTIMIVTHTVVVKLLMSYFEGRPLKEIWNPPYIYPTCLCKIEYEDQRPTIVLHGDISHYKEKPVES